MKKLIITLFVFMFAIAFVQGIDAPYSRWEFEQNTLDTGSQGWHSQDSFNILYETGILGDAVSLNYTGRAVYYPTNIIGGNNWYVGCWVNQPNIDGINFQMCMGDLIIESDPYEHPNQCLLTYSNSFGNNIAYSNAYYGDFNTGVEMPLNQWVHLGMGVNSSQFYMTLNGSIVYTSYSVNIPSHYDLMIGSAYSNLSQTGGFEGLMDECYFLPRTPTPSDIVTMMELTPPPTPEIQRNYFETFDNCGNWTSGTMPCQDGKMYFDYIGNHNIKVLNDNIFDPSNVTSETIYMQTNLFFGNNQARFYQNELSDLFYTDALQSLFNNQNSNAELVYWSSEDEFQNNCVMPQVTGLHKLSVEYNPTIYTMYLDDIELCSLAVAPTVPKTFVYTVFEGIDYLEDPSPSYMEDFYIGYDAPQGFPTPCTPDWSCTGYETCVEPMVNASCNSVVDLNTCGDGYGGDYSEFTPQTCSYPPQITGYVPLHSTSDVPSVVIDFITEYGIQMIVFAGLIALIGLGIWIMHVI